MSPSALRSRRNLLFSQIHSNKEEIIPGELPALFREAVSVSNFDTIQTPKLMQDGAWQMSDIGDHGAWTQEWRK